MKVIYVTSSMPYGPTEAFLAPEIEAVRNRVREVLVVPMYPRGPVLHDDTRALLGCTVHRPLISLDILRVAGGELRRAPNKAFEVLKVLTSSRSVKVLLKNLVVYPKGLWLAHMAREWGAEHIHAHWAATTATMALVASAVSGIPWSFTAHSWDIIDWYSPPNASSSVSRNNLLSLKISRASFTRFICRNGLEKAGFHETELLPTDKILVLHMGVTLPLSKVRSKVRRARGLERPLVVLCPAALVSHKGHRYLIEAIASLRQRGADLELWLVGQGELEKELRERTKALKLSDVVKFFGVLPHSELLDLYRRGEVDVVVLPSLDLGGGRNEGIPVALMEAMSYQIPVVSTSTGGIPKLLGGGGGMLVPPADPAALAGTISRLLEDPELREQQGDAGRRRVEESFNIEKVADELVARFRACVR